MSHLVPCFTDGHFYIGPAGDDSCRPAATTPSWQADSWSNGARRGANTPNSLSENLLLGEYLTGLLRESGSVDRRQWGSRGHSLRQLARRLNNVLAVSTMWRALAIYELAKCHPELHGYKHLGVGHLSVMISLCPTVRLALMRQAEFRRLSKREIQRIVAQIRAAMARGLDPLLHCALDAGGAMPN